MTPQKLSDLRVRVRYAEHGDYEEVIQNLKPVYGGNDYLIVNYHDFIRDRNVVNFVGEIDGKVVKNNILLIINAMLIFLSLIN